MQPMATVQRMGAAWAQVGGCLQPLCSCMGWRGQGVRYTGGTSVLRELSEALPAGWCAGPKNMVESFVARHMIRGGWRDGSGSNLSLE